MKRYRRPKVVEGQMKLQRGKVEGDVDMCVFFGDNVPRCDRALVINIFDQKRMNWDRTFSPSFLDELENRGYDLDTLKFSIEHKAEREALSDENHLDRHLETYTEKGRKDKGNGISHVQRICRIGYNQARHMVDRGIETGVLTNDPEKDYLHRIAPTMSEDRTYKGSGREFGEPE